MEKRNQLLFGSILCIVLASFVFFSMFVMADPEGPGTINITANETYSGSTSGSMVNISGGYIATLNVSTTVQNPHWKAFVGWVNGVFALRDSSGSTIYDWTLTVSSGKIYATRNASTITWSTVGCASNASIETENVALYQTNTGDNITATFNNFTHDAFTIGSNLISANSCRSTSTYVDNSSQHVEFREMVLYDSTSTSTVFVTIMEDSGDGYDENNYDFQMIVPDNGSATWNGAIPYYIYMEVS